MDLLQMVSRFHGMTYREWKSSMIIYCELILVNVFWRDVLKGFYSSGAHRGIFALLFTLKERGDIAWLWKLLCKGRIGNYVSISQLLFFFLIREEIMEYYTVRTHVPPGAEASMGWEEAVRATFRHCHGGAVLRF